MEFSYISGGNFPTSKQKYHSEYFEKWNFPVSSLKNPEEWKFQVFLFTSPASLEKTLQASAQKKNVSYTFFIKKIDRQIDR